MKKLLQQALDALMASKPNNPNSTPERKERLQAITALRAAIESVLVDTESNHLQDVLICGYDEDGDLYIRSSRLTCAEAFFLAHKAALWAQNGGQI